MVIVCGVEELKVHSEVPNRTILTQLPVSLYMTKLPGRKII